MPKAFANFSPGLERSDNPGIEQKHSLNPEESVGKKPSTAIKE